MKIDKISLFNEIEFEHTRSRGPGGQHVNRTESAVICYWNIAQSQIFSMAQKNKIIEKLKNKINAEGFLIVRSEEFREQDRNKKAVFNKLIDLIEKSLYVKPFRVPTKPTKYSQRKRVESKRIQSEKKNSRGKKWNQD